MAHEKLLAELDLRRDKAAALGGPEKLAKRRQRGDLNAIERLDALTLQSSGTFWHADGRELPW